METYPEQTQVHTDRDLPEPLHQRVTVLEKRMLELYDRLEDQVNRLRGFLDRVARELGI